MTTTGTWYPPTVLSNPPFNMTDPINHPPHYTAGPIEVIDILEQAADISSCGSWQLR